MRRPNRSLRQWQLSSTEADYERMPWWLRPTAIQITVPHAAWIDNIPWPQMRDLLIKDPEKYPYSDFNAVYSTNVTVNWPYDAMDSILHTDLGIIMNPIFEKHIQKLDNWTVSAQFKKALPGLAAVINQS
ncbi:hypothetical protein N7540_003152 [Penicillium herquei]|nr:hypothetical protein N7540_003152 [Penicillium herquei]